MGKWRVKESGGDETKRKKERKRERNWCVFSVYKRSGAGLLLSATLFTLDS